MKVSAVIKNPAKDIIQTMNENKSAVISSLIIISGIITGVLIYVVNNENLSNDLMEYFLKFNTDFSHKNKPEIFSGLLLPDLIYLTSMSILGTCAFGAPIVILISIINSMGLGTLTAYIYDSFALEGIEYCLIVLLPGKFLLILAMILLTQNCTVTSKHIKNSIFNKDNRVVDFRKYTARIIVIAIILLLSTLVDYITLTSFISLFNFN